MVQTSPKGSYRTEQLLEYFDELLPVAERPEDSVCLMLDWFSAHLSEEVWEQVVEEKGHMLAFHGGGVTGILQSNDTHLHEPLSKKFKQLEMDDVNRQRRLNRGKIPRRTRLTGKMILRRYVTWARKRYRSWPLLVRTYGEIEA